jgi:hypothetical protein
MMYMSKTHSKIYIPLFFAAVLFSVLSGSLCFALPDPEIAGFQKNLRGKPVGERIAFWAERFVGVPYDEDPQGIYVTRAAIVADDKMDCMYLTFRSVELALSGDPEEAVQLALQKRFHTLGRLQDGKVLNYEDRYEYGEEMVASGKWGKEITASLGSTKRIEGSRGKDHWRVLPPKGFAARLTRLKSGDLIFFIKDPKKRTVGESVGHIGIVKVEEKAGRKSVYLIHASGSKNKGGTVRKVLLKDYLAKMPFIGVQVTRF